MEVTFDLEFTMVKVDKAQESLRGKRTKRSVTSKTVEKKQVRRKTRKPRKVDVPVPHTGLHNCLLCHQGFGIEVERTHHVGYHHQIRFGDWQKVERAYARRVEGRKQVRRKTRRPQGVEGLSLQPEVYNCILCRTGFRLETKLSHHIGFVHRIGFEQWQQLDDKAPRVSVVDEDVQVGPGEAGGQPHAPGGGATGVVNGAQVGQPLQDLPPGVIGTGRSLSAVRSDLWAAGLMPVQGVRLRGRQDGFELAPVTSYVDWMIGSAGPRLERQTYLYHQMDGTTLVRKTARRPLQFGQKVRVMLEVVEDGEPTQYVVGNVAGAKFTSTLPAGCPLPGTWVEDM